MSFTEIERLIDRYDAATTALDQAVTDRIGRSMDAAFRQMVKELERQYPRWASQGSLYASQRRLLLLNELGPLLAIVRPEDAAAYESLMAETLQLSHTTGATLADELVKVRDPGYPLQDFATIPIEAAVAQARDGVGRLSRYSDEFRQRASGIVEQGLIQGFGTKKVQSILEKELGVAKSKAETLARTEILSALNSASQERYQRNGIEWIQVFLTPSESNCPFCVARNGNIYEAGAISVPFHPRCRCLVAPVKRRWQQQGLTDDAAIAKSRAAIVAEFEAGGGRLDTGPTYWEKKAGLTAAPKPVWKPGDAVARAKAKPKPAAPISPPRTALSVADRFRVDRDIAKTLGDIKGWEDFQNNSDSDELWSSDVPELVRGIKGDLQSGRVKPENLIALRDKDGNLQSVATTFSDDGALKVNLLVTAPWNAAGGDPRSTKGAGTAAMVRAIEESDRRGFGGAIKLNALDGAVSFYEKIGMTPGSGYNDFEFSPQAASAFLEAYNERQSPPRSRQATAYRIPDIDTVSEMPMLGDGNTGKVVLDEANNLAIKYNKGGEPLIEKELRLSRVAGELGVGTKVIAVSDDKKAVAIEVLRDYKTFDGAATSMASLSRDAQIQVAKNLVNQLERLHSNRILHNDFHSGNAMFNPSTQEVRIIDYGLANDVFNDAPGSFANFQPLQDLSRLDFWFRQTPGLDGPAVRRVLREMLGSKDAPDYQRILDAIEEDR